MAHIRAKSEGNPQLRRGWAEAVEPVQPSDSAVTETGTHQGY